MKKKKCKIEICHAFCCYNVPLDRRLIGAYRKKIVNPIIRYADEFGDANVALPITDENLSKNKCPFLRNDCRCNIYQQRPQLCRMYGDNGKLSKFLHCRFLHGEAEMSEKEKTDEFLELFQRYHSGEALDVLSSKLGISYPKR